ncbi:heme oxygenase 2-like [Mantella aurantiaca]
MAYEIRASTCTPINLSPPAASLYPNQPVTTSFHLYPNQPVTTSCHLYPNPPVIVSCHLYPNPPVIVSCHLYPNPPVTTSFHLYPNPPVIVSCHLYPNPPVIVSCHLYPNPPVTTSFHLYPNPPVIVSCHLYPNPPVIVSCHLYPNPPVTTSFHLYPNPPVIVSCHLYPNPPVIVSCHLYPNPPVITSCHLYPNPPVTTICHLYPNPPVITSWHLYPNPPVITSWHLYPMGPSDLSELLKEGTKESHDKAENTKFVKDFLKGRIKRDLFKLATAALYYTYSALEEELDRNKEHPAIAPLYFPQELHRAEALKKDLLYFYGEDWEETIQCSEATRNYVERIHHLGLHQPELLVAHAYTRYMGDLSGGQILKKVAQRALHLPSDGDGVQFYMFDNVTNAQQFKQLYRARINTLDLDKEVKENVVEEANRAFRFNMEVFDELDKIGAAIPDEPQEAALPVHDGKGDIRKCPYYTAKEVTGASGCPFHATLALASRPEVKAALAAFAVAIAATIAWYLM